MSWARLNSDYLRHPKVIQLCALLKDPDADRYLPRLWAWCAGNCEGGTLPAVMAKDDFEAACRWRGPPGHLFGLLVKCGLVDVTAGTASVHDWEQMNGAHIRETRRDRERKRLNGRGSTGTSTGVSTGVSEARTDGRTYDGVGEVLSAEKSPPLPPSRGAKRKRAGREQTANGLHYASGVPAVDRLRPGNAGGKSAVIHLGARADWPASPSDTLDDELPADKPLPLGAQKP